MASLRRRPILRAPMHAPAGTRFAPHLLLLAMIVIWGGSYSVVKVSLRSLSPYVVIALRFWIAVACLLPFLRSDVTADLRRSLKPGLAAGFALAVGYLLQTVGMNETSASMGGFLAGLIVLLVAVGGFVLFSAKFGVRSVSGLLLGLAGMIMLCWPAEADQTQQDTLRGILLQVGSSTSYAGHILMLSHLGRGTPAMAFCMWQLVVVAIAATVAALIHGGFAAQGVGAVAWTPHLTLAIVYLGVLATALGIAVQTKVQHRIPPTHVALLFALQPLFAALVGWTALGDHLGARQLLGGAIIVVGMIVTSSDR